MTTKKTIWAMLAAAAMMVWLPGCNGPKKTCKKSAKSYFSLLSSNDWKGMYKMLTKEHQQKIKNPGNFAKFMLRDLEFFGSKSFKLKKLETYPGKDSCNVTLIFDYAVKIRGQEEQQIDGMVQSLIFKKSPADGLWYVEIPGASDVVGFSKVDEEDE